MSTYATGIVKLLQLRIDVSKQIIYGPYPPDAIPFAEYTAHQERFDDVDMLPYPTALSYIGTGNILQSTDGSRHWVEYKVIVTEHYTYEQVIE